jgi:hypothetical protein
VSCHVSLNRITACYIARARIGGLCALMNAWHEMLRKMVYGKSGLRMLGAKNSRERIAPFSPYTATIARV